jgi:hypothetical protein
MAKTLSARNNLDLIPGPKALVDGGAILDNIQDLLHCLQLGYVPEYELPKDGVGMRSAAKGPRPVAVSWRPMNEFDVKRYQTIIGAQLRLLNKAIPDLKAIEVTSKSDGRLLDFDVLSQRIAGVLELSKLSGES